MKAIIPRHRTTDQGVIRDVDITITNEEILEHMEAICPLIEVYRFSRKIYNDGIAEYLPTKTVKLTFRGQYLPQVVYLFRVRFTVETYIQPVMQCKNCYKYGHPTKYCRNKTTCGKCSEQHSTVSCKAHNLKCVNCKLPHMSDSTRCTIYQSQKNIKTKMSELNIPQHEAANIIQGREPYKAALQEFPQLQIYNQTAQNNQQDSNQVLNTAMARGQEPSFKKRKVQFSAPQNQSVTEYTNLLVNPTGRLTQNSFPLALMGAKNRASTQTQENITMVKPSIISAKTNKTLEDKTEPTEETQVSQNCSKYIQKQFDNLIANKQLNNELKIIIKQLKSDVMPFIKI